MEAVLFVHVGVVTVDCYYVCQKHMVGAKFFNGTDFALDTDRAFFDVWNVYLGARDFGKVAFGPFVYVAKQLLRYYFPDFLSYNIPLSLLN